MLNENVRERERRPMKEIDFREIRSWFDEIDESSIEALWPLLKVYIIGCIPSMYGIHIMNAAPMNRMRSVSAFYIHFVSVASKYTQVYVWFLWYFRKVCLRMMNVF